MKTVEEIEERIKIVDEKLRSIHNINVANISQYAYDIPHTKQHWVTEYSTASIAMSRYKQRMEKYKSEKIKASKGVMNKSNLDFLLSCDEKWTEMQAYMDAMDIYVDYLRMIVSNLQWVHQDIKNIIDLIKLENE